MIDIEFDCYGVEKNFPQGGSDYRMQLSKAQALALQSTLDIALSKECVTTVTRQMREEWFETQGSYVIGDSKKL